MHENREISWASWWKDQDRSAKAINRTADMHVQEKSDCAVVPVNQPNKEGRPSAEAGEGRAQTEENIVQSHPALSQLRTYSRSEPQQFRSQLLVMLSQVKIVHFVWPGLRPNYFDYLPPFRGGPIGDLRNQA